MPDKKDRPPSIEVSFGQKELELYYRIKRRCMYINIAGFMKEAAYEKLEREENPNVYQAQVVQQPLYTHSDNDLPFRQEGLANLLDSFDNM
jgi:hypothetical protein